MLETVYAAQLPVGENLIIYKNRIACDKPVGRIAIVSGIHGDELEGQYVCYEMIRRLEEHPEYLRGTVDIYPQVNPLGIDMARRNIPQMEMDLNRIFPGNAQGTVMERAAAAWWKILQEQISVLICTHLTCMSGKFHRCG